MDIFTSKTNYVEFFIKIWKKCPTNCSHCSFAKSWLDFFDVQNILSRIEYGKQLFPGKDMMYFLYWVDFLEYPEYNKLLDAVTATGRAFKIQIAVNDISNTATKLQEIYEKYGSFEVTVANEVNSTQDIKDIFESIKVLSKMEMLRFNYDIITDIQQNAWFVAKLTKLFGQSARDPVHKHLSFPDLGNINLGIGEKFVLDAKNKQVKNISYEHCVMQDLFRMSDTQIVLNDHLELDYEGYFRLHTPLCFLSHIKIAHRDDSPEQIWEKFSVFGSDVSRVQWNMPSKCFDCIKNNYPL